MKYLFKKIPSPYRYPMPAILFILFTFLFFTVHCGSTKDEKAFSKEYLGKWTTKAERYQDRYIEITSDMVIFGTGNDAPNMFFIQKVNQKQNGPENECTFVCANQLEDTEFLFFFIFNDSDDGLTMRLKNPREVIWEKSEKPDLAIES